MNGQSWSDLGPLVSMLPLAAKKGGRAGVAALLQGFQQTRARQRQEAAVKEKTDRELELETMQRELERQRIEAADRGAQAARRTSFLKTYTDGLASVDTPEALDAYLSMMVPEGQAAGLRPDVLRGYATQILAPSRMQQRNAKAYVEGLAKQHGAKWMETAASMMHTVPGSEQPITFDQLLKVAGTPRDPNYAPPQAQKTDRRGFTPVDITVNGKRQSANFDPDTGLYYGIGSDQPLSGDIQKYEKPERNDGGRGDASTNAGLIEAVIANPSLWDNLTPTAKTAIAPELSKRGFGGFGRSMSETSVKQIAETRSAIDGLRDLRQTLSENEQYIGPIAGLQAMNPYSDARQAQAKIDLVRQRVGKALEGGVLRKEDEEKYKRILATLRDEPKTAIFKVDNLIKTLERDIETFENEQRRAGRRVGSVAPSISLANASRAGVLPSSSRSGPPSPQQPTGRQIGRFVVEAEP